MDSEPKRKRLPEPILVINVFATLVIMYVLICMVNGTIELTWHPEIKQTDRDWIKDHQLTRSNRSITIESVQDIYYGHVAGTGSMFPMLPRNSTLLFIVPYENTLNVGDIISYKRNNMSIIHYIHHIGKDKEGTYYLTKGYNNIYFDKKVRFGNISYVMVGVIY